MPSKTTPQGKAASPTSLYAAIEKVLRAARRPMTITEIMAKIEARNLYTFTEQKTKPTTRLAVQLDAAMKRGLLTRVETGVYDLASRTKG